ncbi:chaplin [Streptomyces sp. NPDC028722]|uniref:chaplin n=1 Tax=unclassified Streptomyces TaxID=2593676 RepID=UPI0033FAC09D
MRRTTRYGVIAVAASGAMAVALPVSAAFAAEGAGANATATGSPGVLSGNSVQVPVHAPVNVCGNTVDVVGLLNPAAGNTCVNGGSATTDGAGGSGSSRAAAARKGTAAHTVADMERGGSAASGGASAHGTTAGSPGLLSGNDVQIPVHLPVNVSGNSVNVVGVGNPVFDNESVNGSGDHSSGRSHSTVPRPRAPKPPAAVRAHTPPHTPRQAAPSLAHTGADLTAPALAGSAALIVAGAILYRRYTPGQIR